MALLLGHRLLRKWNQTGDKWASLPDIADWFDMPQHQIPLTIVYFVGKFENNVVLMVFIYIVVSSVTKY